MTSCGGGRCSINVTAGDRKLRVETDARLMSTDEALGRPRGIAERAAGALGGAIIRRAGIGTMSTVVGMGTREVYDTEARQYRLSCRIMWIDEETRGKDEGDDGRSYERYTEGMACDGYAGADSSWRFRLGISPERDSLQKALESIIGMRPSPTGSPTTPKLVKSPAESYAFDFHTVGSGGRESFRWTVRRSDSTAIGAVYFQGFGSAVAVDLAPAATADESIILRMLGVALMQRLEKTR